MLSAFRSSAATACIGGIIVENYEREYAFSDSDVRLLSTVASSMGVALENARLFDETQRLLKETEQRNAELAIINSVQAGAGGRAQHPGYLRPVGDKIREIFHNADMSIRILRSKAATRSLSVHIRERRAADDRFGAAS